MPPSHGVLPKEVGLALAQTVDIVSPSAKQRRRAQSPHPAMKARGGKVIFTLVMSFILIIGLALAGVALWRISKWADFTRQSRLHEGVVVRNDNYGNTTYSPVVEYTSDSGERVEFNENSMGSNPPTHEVGQRVIVGVGSDGTTRLISFGYLFGVWAALLIAGMSMAMLGGVFLFGPMTFNSWVEGFNSVPHTARSAPRPAGEGASYMDIGLDQFNSGDYDAAIASFTSALEVDPDQANAYAFLGDAYLQKKNYRPAIKNYTKAIELTPDDPRLYNTRGVAFFNLKEFGPSAENFGMQVELEPDNPDAYYNKGLAYAGMNDHRQALQGFTKSIELDAQNPSAFSARANSYLNIHEMDKALADYKTALGLDPRHMYSAYGMACYHAMRNETEKGCDWLERAIEFGFEDFETIKSDTMLQSLRRAPCYGSIMGKR